MEANYIKSTVGPVLAEALVSLVLHYPFTTVPSSYATSIDPISFVGQYLLDANQKKAETKALNEVQGSLHARIHDFEKKQIAQKDSRVKFESDLKQKVADRYEIVEAQLAVIAAAVAAKNAPPPVVEEEKVNAPEEAEEEKIEDVPDDEDEEEEEEQ